MCSVVDAGKTTTASFNVSPWQRWIVGSKWKLVTENLDLTFLLTQNCLVTSNTGVQFLFLSYIQLSNSFLIGRKPKVNFRNQRSWRHNCRLYNNHVKVTGNHVKVTGYHVMYDRSAWFPRVIISTLHDSCWLPSVKKQKHDFQVFAFVQCIIKQLLDSVFVKSRIIKVSVRVISLSLRLRLITLTSTLIILDITKTSSNNSLVVALYKCAFSLCWFLPMSGCGNETQIILGLVEFSTL